MDMEGAWWCFGAAVVIAAAIVAGRKDRPDPSIAIMAVLAPMANAALSLLAFWGSDGSTLPASIDGLFFALFLAAGATFVGASAGIGLGWWLSTMRQTGSKPQA